MPNVPFTHIDETHPALEFKTERLLLRRFMPWEGSLLTELDSDPEVTRYINDGAEPRPDLDAKAMDYFQSIYEQFPGLGFFAAHLRASGEYIGWFHFRPDRHQPEDVDLGYRLKRAHWGQGLASEGSRALLQHGFEQLNIQTVVAYALLANQASWGVMQKLGMQRVQEFNEERFPGTDKRAVKYTLTATDYFSTQSV